MMTRPAAGSLLVALIAVASCSGRPPATSEVPPAMAAAHPVLQAPAPSAPVDAVATTVQPAGPAITVEAVWKTRTAISGKTVTVHGKVVKFNGGILGVNWVHLQDGTGTAKDGSNDITVTTDAVVQPGDEVTVTGSVTLNKDLGSGYLYPVIIERASVARR